MTLHCWQHWFWITGIIPAVLLVLTLSRPSSASAVSWEAPLASVWTSTTWLQSAPGAPPTWAIQRRLLGFAMPQPPSAGAAAAAVAAGGGAATPGVPAEPTPTLAVATPTIEAVVYTLSPLPDDNATNFASVPSVSDAHNKSSQTVNTASSPSPVPTQKSPPSKPARPKAFKPYVASMPKTSMPVKPAKVATSSTSTTTTTTSTTTEATPTSSSSWSSEIPETSTSTEDVIADPPAELMNDSPVEASAASMSAAASSGPMIPNPGAGAGAGAVPGGVSVGAASPGAAPFSSAAPPNPMASAMTPPVPTEAPQRREQSRELEIIHPGVSFDNVSKQHALSSNEGYGGLDAGSITGIALGVVLFAALVGSASFVLYRRRFLNKPQTLNDKCSNPDSSGYIDDSTLRENSEEMYSLDNDSFLNSLEAMTIQNYWTDSVKHTKL